MNTMNLSEKMLWQGAIALKDLVKFPTCFKITWNKARPIQN
jgi:hypothetical protein